MPSSVVKSFPQFFIQPIRDTFVYKEIVYLFEVGSLLVSHMHLAVPVIQYLLSS